MAAIIHPGEFLREEMDARGLSANALARKLAVPPGRVVDILNGKRAVSADTALRLGRYLGTGPRLWMALQSRYELALAERDKGAEIARDIEAA
jgi:addiction module HigA family antidote